MHYPRLQQAFNVFIDTATPSFFARRQIRANVNKEELSELTTIMQINYGHYFNRSETTPVEPIRQQREFVEYEVII